jgi:dihydroneopterin aldolase
VVHDTSVAARTDHLADTISYSRVARRIVEVGTKERVRLIETLAQRMADAVLSDFPVEAVRIRLRKVRPPTDVIAAAAGVEIERRRKDVGS